MEGSKVTFVLLLCLAGGVRKCHSETAPCNPTACKTSSCSTNADCECLTLTSNIETGVCAALVLSCSSVLRCNTDNRTCPIENTVCVSNTRCQHPVCYPLALADKLVCPSSVSTVTAAPSARSCPLNRISSIIAESNDVINFNTRFADCPSCVNVTVNSNARIYNVCSTEQLNVTVNGNGAVTMQQSSDCPSYVNVTVNSNGNVYNICSTNEVNITANGNARVTMKESFICPKVVNITATGNARVYNICVSDHLTVLSTTGNNLVSMDYKQMSSCPKTVDIVYGGGISTFYVCATQAINAKLTSIATLYYKGPLNHTEVTSLASIRQWV